MPFEKHDDSQIVGAISDYPAATITDVGITDHGCVYIDIQIPLPIARLDFPATIRLSPADARGMAAALVDCATDAEGKIQ